MQINDIYVQKQGNGPALILLHSWCGSHADWTKIARQLSDHFTIYAWDARGHGQSTHNATAPNSLSLMAEDLNRLVDEIAPHKPIIVGHSMGAFVLWQYLETFGQDRLSKIAIIDQTPKLLTQEDWTHGIYGDFAQSAHESFLDNLQIDFAETVLKLAAHGHNKTTLRKYNENSTGIQGIRSYLARLDPKPLIEIWEDLGRADFRTLLPKIDLPTLLIYGGESNYYGKAVADYMQQHIPDNQLHYFDDADHSPHLKRPEKFVQAIKEFGL